MPHHFKWINRATLLFNLASAELVGGWVWEGRFGARAGGGVIRDARACLSLSRMDRLDEQTDGGAGEGMEGQKDLDDGRRGFGEVNRPQTWPSW